MVTWRRLLQRILKLLDRVENYLLIWAAWFKHAGRPKLGYPPRAVPFSTGGESSRYDDWASIEEEKDAIWQARTLDALIEGLSRKESKAVRHVHLQERSTAGHEGSYQLALETLERGINARGLP